MTGNKFLLDTNIIVAWLNGENKIADKIDNAQEVFIPIVALGELYFGAMNSDNVEKNITEIQKLIDHYEVLLTNRDTSLSYGRIKTALRKKGKPIPENDIWIAAIGQEQGLIIVTRDKHFKEIENIKMKTW